MKLLGIEGMYAGAEFALDEPMIIGRNESVCNLIIHGNPKISGQHCKLEAGQGFIILTDLGSTNGTYLSNGAKLVPVRFAASAGQKCGDEWTRRGFSVDIVRWRPDTTR